MSCESPRAAKTRRRQPPSGLCACVGVPFLRGEASEREREKAPLWHLATIDDVFLHVSSHSISISVAFLCGEHILEFEEATSCLERHPSVNHRCRWWRKWLHRSWSATHPAANAVGGGESGQVTIASLSCRWCFSACHSGSARERVRESIIVAFSHWCRFRSHQH